MGDESGLANYEGEVTDLGGKFIMPGVIDSHVHVTIGVYSLCIWIQCVVYIHRKKWLNKTI